MPTFKNRNFVVVGDSNFVSSMTSVLQKMGATVHTTLINNFTHIDGVLTQRDFFESNCDGTNAEISEAIAKEVPIIDENWVNLCEEEGFYVQPQRDYRLDLHCDRTMFRAMSDTFDPSTEVHVDPTATSFTRKVHASVPKFEASPGHQTPQSLKKQQLSPESYGGNAKKSPPPAVPMQAFPSQPANSYTSATTTTTTATLDAQLASYTATSSTVGFNIELYNTATDSLLHDNIVGSELKKFYIVLHCCDLAANSNKYYVMELHKELKTGGGTGTGFVLLTHYGRTDDLMTNPKAGNRDCRSFPNVQLAQQEYLKIVKQKKAKGYDEVRLISCKVGTVQLQKAVERIYLANKPYVDPLTQFASTTQPSTEVIGLANALYHEAEQALSSTIVAKVTKYGVETPLGALSEEQVQAGRAVLDDVDRLLLQIGEQGAVPRNEAAEAFRSYSTAFFTLIPHYLGGRQRSTVETSVIASTELLDRKRDLMQVALDLIRASATMASGGDVDDEKLRFFALRSKMQLLSPMDAETQTVREVIEKSMQRTKCEIRAIYAISREAEVATRKNVDNADEAEKGLLFHGSRAANWYGILSRGILLPKAVTSLGVKRTNVGWLGAGIYFANSIDTVTRYCHPGMINPTSRFVALTEVRYGKRFCTTSIDTMLTAPPQGFQSVCGLGTHGNEQQAASEFEDDEYVVYTSEQHYIKYLVEFACDAPLPPPGKQGEQKHTQQQLTASSKATASTAAFGVPQTSESAPGKIKVAIGGAPEDPFFAPKKFTGGMPKNPNAMSGYENHPPCFGLPMSSNVAGPTKMNTALKTKAPITKKTKAKKWSSFDEESSHESNESSEEDSGDEEIRKPVKVVPKTKKAALKTKKLAPMSDSSSSHSWSARKGTKKQAAPKKMPAQMRKKSPKKAVPVAATFGTFQATNVNVASSTTTMSFQPPHKLQAEVEMLRRQIQNQAVTIQSLQQQLTATKKGKAPRGPQLVLGGPPPGFSPFQEQPPPMKKTAAKKAPRKQLAEVTVAKKSQTAIQSFFSQTAQPSSSQSPSVASSARLPASDLNQSWDISTPQLLLHYINGTCKNPLWNDSLMGPPIGPQVGGLRNQPCPVNSDEENDFLKISDDSLRASFLNDRQSSMFHDRYISLIDVYSNEHYSSFMRSGLSPKELATPRVLDQWTKFNGHTSSVNDAATFFSRFESMTQGQLKGVNWDNLFVAGGCILGCLMKEEEAGNGFRGSDIDLFMYGLSEEEAVAKVKHIYDIVSKNRAASGIRANQVPDLVRTSHAITIVGGYPFRHIQIVLRMYLIPAEVIVGFDIDSCAVGFDGHRAYVTGRARRALNKRVNYVDMSRRSLTYEVRLQKYAKRGIAVMVPNLKLDRVDPKVYQRGIKAQAGLAKLLAFDQTERLIVEQERSSQSSDSNNNNNKKFGFKNSPTKKQSPPPKRVSRAKKAKVGHRGRKSKRKARKLMILEGRGYVYTGKSGRPKKADWSEKVQPETTEPDSEEEEKGKIPPKITWQSDYDELMLPWGPAWHNWNLKMFMIRKDKAQLFHSNEHRHIAISGLENVLSGVSEWCGQCKAGVPTTDTGELNAGYVSGPLRFYRSNPGTQLMTASFHPIRDDHYADGVYLPDGTPSVVPPLHMRAYGNPFQPVTSSSAVSTPTNLTLSPGTGLAFGSLTTATATTMFTKGPPSSPGGQKSVGSSGAIVQKLHSTVLLVKSKGFSLEQFLLQHNSGIHQYLTSFDLDGTLLVTKSGKRYPNTVEDWKWTHPNIPSKLKELSSPVIIFANQNGIGEKFVKAEVVTARVCAALESIGVEFVALLATGDDYYRKPSTGLWGIFAQKYLLSAPPQVTQRMCFVGDAAGRATDFSDTDKRFAHNINATFKTPEEYFGFEEGKKAHPNNANLTTEAFSDSELFQQLKNAALSAGAKRTESFHKASSSFGQGDNKEIVLLVGPPCSGKTTFAQKYLCPHGYVLVNQEGSGKSVEMTHAVLSTGSPAVIDGLLPMKEHREPFIQLAKELHCPIRCLVLDSPSGLPKHLDTVRMRKSAGAVQKTPAGHFQSYETVVLPPTTTEGFESVEKVDFVPEFDTEWDRVNFFSK